LPPSGLDIDFQIDRPRTAHQPDGSPDGRADRGPGAGASRDAYRSAAAAARLRLSIILVEQNSRVALGFSDHAVVMDKGRIVYDGGSALLRDDPERLARLVGIAEARG